MPQNPKHKYLQRLSKNLIMTAKTQALFYWFALLFTLLLGTSGCAPKKSMMSTVKEKDSIHVKHTIKPYDTLVTIPGNKAQVSVNIADLLAGMQFENSRNNLTAGIRREGDTIIAYCDQSQNEMIIRLQRELIETFKSHESEKDTTITVPENIVPWYMVTFLWLGGIVALVFVIHLIFQYLTRKKSTNTKTDAQ